MSWEWIRSDVVLALHERQLAENGGPEGIRDSGALESALARAPNLDAYGKPDVAALAAAYAGGIARNHPFVDGNKRTAWVLARLFLDINGFELTHEKEEAIAVMFRFAAGELTEDELADWFRQRVQPR